MRRKSPHSRRSSLTNPVARIRRCCPRRGYHPAVSSLEDRTLLSTVTWINPSGGDWDTPSNWSTGTVPGPADDAVIGLSGVTVTHSTSAADSVNSLTISASDASLEFSNGSLSLSANSSMAGDLMIQGGTLSTLATLTVAGPLTWSGGVLNSTGAIDAEGGMDITGGTLDGVTLNNEGAATCSGDIAVMDGATINNLAGATFDVQGDVSLGYGGGAVGTFNNQPGATFAVADDGSDDGAQAALVFNNDGAVDLDSGSLLMGFLFAASVQGDATSGGTFYGAPGTSLDFWAVSQDFAPTSSIDAANVGFIAGGYQVEGSYAASGQTQLNVGATVDFTGTVLDVGSSLDIVPSNADASADFSPAVPTTLTTGECTLTGTLTGTDSFVITGSLTLAGGTLSSTGTTDVEGGMTITGGTLSAGTLNNDGTATLSGGIGVGDGATINNLAGATFDVQGDVSLGYGGGAMATFNNDAGATFAVSNDGDGGTQANVLFDNAGVVDVNSGGLTVGFPYANSVVGSATSSGSFYGAPGTSLTFGAVSQDFTPTSSIDAANIGFVVGGFDVEGSYAASGQTQLNVGATVDFTGTVLDVGSSLDIVPSNADASADFSPAVPTTLTTGECTLTGTLTGTDSFVITGSLTLAGGTLSSTGTTDVEGGMTITGGTLDAGTLNNDGTATLSGGVGVGDGATINNLAGATFDVQGDVSLGYGGGAVGTFNNQPGATFAVADDGSDDGAQAALVFNNDGAVNLDSGSLLMGFLFAASVQGDATSGGTFYGRRGRASTSGRCRRTSRRPRASTRPTSASSQAATRSRAATRPRARPSSTSGRPWISPGRSSTSAARSTSSRRMPTPRPTSARPSPRR